MKIGDIWFRSFYDMKGAKLKFDRKEITMGAGATFGRASDNLVSFPDDTNVSRYHAEIEKRGDEFFVIDLGSSNGTTVNGSRVNGEMPLSDGDTIAFGGISKVEIEYIEESKQTELPTGAVPAASDATPAESEETGPAANRPKTLIVAGVAVGLAVICAVGAGAFYYTRGAQCNARAVIVSPEPGDTITKETEIEVEAENVGCVERAIFLVDGVEFARTSDTPFTATIDPKDFPDQADGFDHSLTIVLEDTDGNRIAQPGSVLLAFDTAKVSKPSPTPVIAQGPTPIPGVKGKEVSLIEVQQMTTGLVKQFSGNFAYNVSNKQFLQEVQKQAREFAQEGYFDRAAAYRDAINVAYVQQNNLDAPLGFILAMSRSKFVPDAQGGQEGLWKMSPAFVKDNKYDGQCGAEVLSDPAQNCAAKASALYLKAVVFGVFDGDMIYSVAAFGKSPQDAGAWKATLPANRADIWNVIKTQQERDQVVRFFAAGIVAENPQKFGLKKDRPISELYKITM